MSMRQMGKIRYIVLLSLALLVVLVPLVYFRYGRIKGANKAKAPAAARVEVVAAKREMIPDVITFTADLEPRQRATITSKVSGVITRMRVAEGDYVRAGGVLAEIEQDDYLAALQAAEANMAEAEANLEMCQKDHERFAQLVAKGAISQQRYDQAKTAYQLAQAHHRAAKAALNNARKQLEETVIRAPFSGFVTARLKEVGERVRGGLPGIEAAVLQMDDISSVKATGYLAERQIMQVRQGMKAELTVDAIPDKTFVGRVSVVNPRVDPTTRTFMVKVEVPNKGYLLKGDMFARVSIVAGHREAITVPREAVMREEGVWLYHCFVVVGGRAQRRVIKPIFTPFAYVEVAEGLKEGELVVVKGQQGLSGGETVVAEGGDEAP